MALSDKLEDWTAAGLIDAATAERIAAYEEERARPVGLWAVAGLGGLAVSLGIILFIAANWDAIPAAVKLGIHFLLTAAAGVAVWAFTRRGTRWGAEIALFLLAALMLGGLALQSQIYQLTGDLWPLLLTWLAATGPALLVLGRTRLTAYALAGMSVWTVGSMASAVEGDSLPELLLHGTALATPWLLVVAAGLAAHRPPFASGLKEAGIAVLLPAVSLAHLAWANELTPSDAAEFAIRFLVVAGAAVAAILFAKRRNILPVQLQLPLLLGPAVAAALAVCIPHADWWLPRLIGAGIFFAMWSWIGWAASRAAWRALFGIAVAAIAIRIFIVYFELFGSQATTGLGLIAAGLLLIGLAFAGRRVFAEMPG